MWSDDAEQAPQPVQCLDHRGDERRVAAVTRKDLPDRNLQSADELLGFLTFLIGHSPLLYAAERPRGQRSVEPRTRSRRFSASRIRDRAVSRSVSASMPTKVPSLRSTTGSRV